MPCPVQSSGAITVRILIADDNPGARSSLRWLLEEHSAWKVCGEAANGLDAVRQAEAIRPDLVILDLVMPELDGIRAGRRIHAAFPETPILLFTLFRPDTALVQEAMDAGFRGVHCKDSYDDLINTIESLFIETSRPDSGASATLPVANALDRARHDLPAEGGREAPPDPSENIE